MRPPATPSERLPLLAFLRRMVVLGLVIAAILAFGTVGFSLAEGANLWDAFVWSLDTVATVGSIQAPENTGTQIIKAILIVTGVGTLFYALVTVTEFFVAGHLGQLLADRRRQTMIDSLTDHFIICGFGRVGRQVARDLREAGAKYVVIDNNADNREMAGEIGMRFLEGDAADDDVLRAAGIERARAVLACVDSDADNIFITLTARGLRDDIEIVARAAAEESERKLVRAGADRVISPYKTSGAEMARYALHPQVAGIVDITADYRFEEIEVSPGCAGAGRTVSDVRGDAFVVAVRRADGSLQQQPAAGLVLSPGDVLMAMGTVGAMDRLVTLFDAPAHQAASQ